MKDKINVRIKDANSIKDLENIFLDVYIGFISYEFSLDDFSYYCGQINLQIINLKIKDLSNLFEITDNGLELDWYIRQENMENKVSNILNRIHEYAHKLAESKGISVPNIQKNNDDQKE